MSKKSKRIELDMKTIHEYRKKGFSYRAISEIYDCSPTTISRRYREWLDNMNWFQKILLKLNLI